MNIKTTIGLMAGVLFCFGAGYYVGSLHGYSSGYSNGYQKSRVEIKQRLVETKLIDPTPLEIRTISGTIKSIGVSQFVLESRLPYDPTLSNNDQRAIERTVVVTPNTAITIRTIQSATEKPKPGEPIRPFVVRNDKVEFSSLSVGEQVIVGASENIANKMQFEANAIFKNSQ